MSLSIAARDLKFDRRLFTFDYSRVDAKYHASLQRDEEIVVYKGARIGFDAAGFVSLALHEHRLDHLVEVKKTIEEGNEDDIYRILDRHTSYYGYTPFLSAHPNPEWAQVFASTHPLRVYDRTIYELRIKAERCIIDAFDTGKCGMLREVLIFGAIFPYEVTRVKIVNDDHHSELLENGKIRRRPDKNSRNVKIKDPTNWRSTIPSY